MWKLSHDKKIFIWKSVLKLILKKYLLKNKYCKDHFDCTSLQWHLIYIKKTDYGIMQATFHMYYEGTDKSKG